jgi:5-methylcytosine-specific restriction endonuclease McrA
MKWAPIAECLKDARTRRGYYLCAGCGEEVPASTKDEKGKRVKNILVDHIDPIIDPAVGWVNWDSTIDRMFSEPSNLQALCYDCHKIKTDNEKAVAKQRRIELKEAEDDE